jgi:hypothetical protein
MMFSPSMKTAMRGRCLDRSWGIADNIDATPCVAERQLRANGNPSRVPVDYIPRRASVNAQREPRAVTLRA